MGGHGMIDAMRVQATFEDFELFKCALRLLRDAGVSEYTGFGPTNLQDVENLMPDRFSPVRGIATTGFIIGLVVFWAITIATSLIYSLVVGGKPPISNVPFVVTAYEGAMLLSGIASIIGVIIFSNLDVCQDVTGFAKKFATDSYGIEVRCRMSEATSVNSLLVEAGATEVGKALD